MTHKFNPFTVVALVVAAIFDVVVWPLLYVQQWLLAAVSVRLGISVWVAAVMSFTIDMVLPRYHEKREHDARHAQNVAQLERLYRDGDGDLDAVRRSRRWRAGHRSAGLVRCIGVRRRAVGDRDDVRLRRLGAHPATDRQREERQLVG